MAAGLNACRCRTGGGAGKTLVRNKTLVGEMRDKDHNAIIHVGAAKCGSSSLQRHLSRNPVFMSRDGIRYAYCVIDSQGRFRGGDEVDRAARRSPFGYDCCVNFRVDEAFAENFLKAAGDCQRMAAQRNRIILSNEGWSLAAPIFAEKDILDRMGLRAKVVMFVRPPLDWMHSGWWQWGAWIDRPIENWMRRAIEEVKWDEHIERWKSVSGVSSVEVRLATHNVIDQFFDILNAQVATSRIVNSTLSPDILRFLQRNRQFRDAKGAQVDFILGRWVDFGTGAAPWVLPLEMQREVMETIRPHNEKLLAMLRPADREEVRNDPRWWTEEPYADREVEPVHAVSTVKSADAVIASFMEAIVRIDERFRERLD